MFLGDKEMKTKSKNKKSNRPGCWTLAVLALIGLSLLPSSNQAQAQTDVDDFVHGQGAPADNGDSVFVPGVKWEDPATGEAAAQAAQWLRF